MSTKQSVGFIAGLALAVSSSFVLASDGSIANTRAENLEVQNMDEMIAEYYIEKGEATAAGPQSQDMRSMRYENRRSSEYPNAHQRKWEQVGND
ncbi:hypothetical protein [Hahella sp. HN01]|uniref:hypothetical protein n=1 Tax=unclassified Hahella TaxID=2624107 RepID=UPI001C1EA50C|nr:hypothetical protein [Hahella sp. HN01]MBU6950341.1 hypothetical protein [Hahella sp. HN01]